MKHLLTLSDKNYVTYGLCLYDSISKHSSDFTLHYLAMDEETEDTLKRLNLENIKVYSMKDIEDNPQFQELKLNNESRPIDISDGQSDFHWALASFFSAHLLNSGLPHILYIDSDILFYRDVQTVFDAVGDKSIGLITHKHIRLHKVASNPGYYNVGIIYFKNDDVGSQCLNFWKDCCVYPDNEYAPVYGVCGDQKYLELFDELFGEENIEVLCHKGGNGAPWNFTMLEFKDNNRVLWTDPEGLVLSPGESIEQDLVFNHFSHFKPDYDDESFNFDRGGEWGPYLPTHPGVKETYIDYFVRLLDTRERYEL